MKEASLRFEMGGTVGLMERAVMGGGKDVWGIRGVVGRWGWDVESPTAYSVLQSVALWTFYLKERF